MNLGTQVEGDVSESVDRLVSVIDRAVDLIQRLRRENSELNQQRKALKEEVVRKEGELEALAVDRDRLQHIYDENAILIGKKEEIQDKVEAMLARLESLEIEGGDSETT